MRKTKSKKWVWLLVMLFVVTQSSQHANALPTGDNFLYDSLLDVTFSMGSGSAEVDCKVYKYTSGDYADKYVYTYRISNVDSSIGLSFFSVGILDDANAYDPDFDVLVGAVEPALWAIVRLSPPETQVESVNGLFTHTIDNGFSSASLWFVSDYASTSSSGVLFGTSSGAPCYATGDLLTPIPEPATIFMFGTGWLMTLIRKR